MFRNTLHAIANFTPFYCKDINSRLTVVYDSIYVIFCGSFNALDVRKINLTGKNED